MRKIVYLIFIFALTQCSKKEDETTCIPLPNFKDVNIVDKVTEVNVFSNGTFTQNQLQIITNPANLFPVNFNQSPNNTVFKVVPTNTTGFVNFSIVLNNEITIPLKGKIIVTNGCGTNYYFESIVSENPDYTIEDVGTNLKIKI